MCKGALDDERLNELSIRALPLHTSLEGESAHAAIRLNTLATLRPHLPVSLPLYRRLQFGRFFEATTLLTNLSLDGQKECKEPNPKARDPESDEPWLIAFVDRSCRPETEVWLFCSWESHLCKQHGHDTRFGAEDKQGALIRNLLKAMRAMPAPESIHQDILNAKAARLEQKDSTAKDSVGLSRSDYASHMLDPSIMLWGATHESTVPILQRLGVASGEKFKAAATPNLMFVWDVDALAPEESLPDELVWGKLTPTHFPLVRSRTQIPRQDRTLAVLPNLGIFPSVPHMEQAHPAPIAWVFVGLDGSLTTLHVEPEWRGRGLAKAVTTKLFRENMHMFWEEGLTRWAHGYVIRGNQESEGMCRSLKGASDWDVYWTRVNLEAL